MVPGKVRVWNIRGAQKFLPTVNWRALMKSVILWLMGVPIVVIILLNLTGMLGH